MRSDASDRARPPWCPDDGPWPPRRGPHGPPRWARGPFLFRFGVFFLPALFFAALGVARLVWLASEQAGLDLPRPVLPLAAFAFLLIVVPLLFWSGMRRVGMPLGDIVEAADRVGRGDYSPRLIERGPPFLRTVARAFNSMTARLAVHEKQRRDLMADVAHELRTPLAIVRGRLEGMIDGVYAHDEASLVRLVEETKLVERLVEDLRTLAHTESGTLRLQRETTDLAVLVHEVVRAFTPIAAVRRITLSAEGVTDLPLVDVDPLRIREVLVNLLTNAIRYTPDEGRIAVSAGTDETGVQVTVEDSGPGIREEDLPRVFDRFAKGTDSQGSGLGLTIARNLIVAHGGEISARNREEGGARFSFAVPLDREPRQ